MGRIELRVDHREKNVLRHQDALSQTNYMATHLTTADYVLIDTTTQQIVCCIERKSLEDYAASLKDKRSQNKEKLKLLREKTGCRIIYLIECGARLPSPNDTYGRIAYKNIESSIFHLILRDNIVVMWTKDTLDTAQTLVRLVNSTETLLCRDWDPLALANDTDKVHFGAADNVASVATGGSASVASVANDANDASVASVASGASGASGANGANNTACIIDTVNDHAKTVPDINQLLTQAHLRSDADILRGLWSTFRGITNESAGEYIHKFTLGQIIKKEVSEEQIRGLKTALGKSISRKVVQSLTNISVSDECKLLGNVPGISRKTAEALISQTRLAELISIAPETISDMKVGKNKLGSRVGQNIRKYFEMKL